MECYKCSQHVRNIDEYQKHINSFHKYDNKYICNLCNNERFFVKLNSFQKHLKRHKSKNEEMISKDPIQCDLKETINDCFHDFNPINFDQLNDAIKSTRLTMVTKLYKNHNICRKSVQEIINIILEYLHSDVFILAEALLVEKMQLNDFNTSNNSLSIVTKVFNALRNSLFEISTEHRRINLLNRSSFYIPPESIITGARVDQIRRGKKIILKTVDSKASFISLRTTLQCFFEQDNTLSIILKYISELYKMKEGISNIVQTDFWKMKTLSFPKNSIVLPLTVYFDEFETNNALGSRAGFQNLGVVYFSCPCFPPTHRSKLEYIFMAMLINSLDRKSFGNRVFHPVIDDLKSLESDGIQVFGQKIFFLLTVCIGDNKGVNSMLGFTECFIANYYCRHCKMHKNDAKKSCVENPKLLRNRENYIADLKLNDISKTGIHSVCVFNSLKYFHATENYAVDVMHDIFEGILKYEIALILKRFIYEDKYFSLEQLNERIAAFDFGLYEHINKPQEISYESIKKDNLKYSASEMMWLARYLPLFIGDLIPKENSTWELFLLLKQIIYISLLEVVDKQSVKTLKILISEHHNLYINHFKLPLKPKHHILTHYPRLMETIGPIIHIWSMRFEAKHKILKEIAKSTQSRRNICHTISERYLLRESFNRNQSKFETFQDSGREITPNTSFYNDVLNRHFGNIKSLSYFNWYKIHNLKYKSGSVIQIGNDDDYPIFALIDFICVFDSKDIFLAIQKLRTEYFDKHKDCHVVEFTKKYDIFHIDSTYLGGIFYLHELNLEKLII